MWLMIAAALAVEPPDLGPFKLPTWLAGCWEESSNGRWTVECWTTSRGGMMMGSSRTGKGLEVMTFEHMRITSERAGVSFCAIPNGQAGRCFDQTKESASEVVFENPEHDFPTRISYRRDGNDLVAEVSGPNSANRQSWRYTRTTD